MKQLIEDRYIGAKVGDTIGVVDRRGFIAPDGGGGSDKGNLHVTKIYNVKSIKDNFVYVEVENVH